MDAARVGVFICDRGSNIAGFLDVPRLTEYVQTLPHVAFAQENMYTCSDAGRAEITKAITEHDLNRVVVASCTPRTHEPLFRATCQQAGLNPYLFEFVNIRDQCSWVHMQERERATAKAQDLLRMGVARAALLEPKESISVDVVRAALVIGGGVAGLSAALNLANRGFEVKLVERQAQMGGLLRNVHTLYPTGVEAYPFIEERVRAVGHHPNVQVFTEASVRDVRGYVGNYEVVVAQGDREYGMAVGVIIVATGAHELPAEGVYGHDAQRVITQGEFERRLAQGPDPSEWPVRSVVMIQCAGARSAERPYCSRICCMTAIKNALLIRAARPDVLVCVLYRDMLTLGTEYEDLYRKAREQGVVFVQYDPGSLPMVGERSVEVYDARLGKTLSIPGDLVVLSVPLVPREGASELARMLKVPLDEYGFFLEAHAKLRPLDFSTDGIYLCGSAHWPSGVGESVSQALGAAARASILLEKGRVEVEPIISVVDADRCIGCGLCEIVCPFGAVTLEDTGAGRKAQTIAASCKGCGVCGAGCPERAITMQHFTDEQLFAQVDAMMEPVP